MSTKYMYAHFSFKSSQALFSGLGTTPSDDGRWPYLELERIFIDFLCSTEGDKHHFFSSSISATWLQQLYSWNENSRRSRVRTWKCGFMARARNYPWPSRTFFELIFELRHTHTKLVVNRVKISICCLACPKHLWDVYRTTHSIIRLQWVMACIH